MDQSFCCFIEIDGQKYDIIINKDISYVGFKDIFQKIQQIIKLVLKQEISFETHVFEVFDNNSSEGLVVKGFDNSIKNLSTIRIHRNPVVSPPNLVTPLNPNLPSIGLTPLPFVPSIPTSSTSSEKTDDDLIPHKYYCDLCPKYVDKKDMRLKKYKLNLNFESYKRFSDLMTTIKELLKSDCDTISDNQWLFTIPYKMLAFGHKDFSPKMWKNTFEVFLKKYIEVMDVSPNCYVACSLFPFLHEFNAFQFNEKITELRHKLNKSSSKLPKMSEKERLQLRNLVQKMTNEKEDIKVFHLIVQLVKESKLMYKKRSKKKWQRISDILREKRYFSKNYSWFNCRDKFVKWASFFAQNYSKLNGYSEQIKEQEVFDLLKIIHILDFDKMWANYNNPTYSILRTLSDECDIKLYLNDLEKRKHILKHIFKPLNKRKVIPIIQTRKVKRDSYKSFSNFNSIADKDSNTEEKDLKYCDECSECLSLLTDCECRPQPQSGQKSQTIRSSNSQIKPLNCVTSQSGVIPLPREKLITSSHSTPKVEDTLPEIQTIETVNKSKLISMNNRSAQPLPSIRDPRLKRKLEQQSEQSVEESSNQSSVQNTNKKTADKCDANNDSFVIHIPTNSEVVSSMSPNQKTTSQVVSLSKACYSKLISMNNRSAQPLASVRDLRLKPKLEQQSEQSVKESSNQSSVQNTSKKTADKCDANNDSFVKHIPTNSEVVSSMSPNQKTTSQEVSLSKAPNSCNIDPRFQRKCNSNARVEDTLPEIQIIGTVNKSKPISRNSRSAKLLISIRYSQIKRKLEQQSEQSVKESSNNSCVQNTSKTIVNKSKIRPINGYGSDKQSLSSTSCRPINWYSRQQHIPKSFENGFNQNYNNLKELSKKQKVVSHPNVRSIAPNSVVDCNQQLTSLFNVHSNHLPKVSELYYKQREIEDFYSIVLAINIGWNFRVSDNLSVWQKVSDSLRNKGKLIMAKQCRSIFSSLTQYYCQKYYEYEGKIHPSSQVVFDLLKVVHVLDLDQFFRDIPNNPITKISKRKELIEYYVKHLRDIRLNKSEEKEKEFNRITNKSNRNNNKNKLQQKVPKYGLTRQIDEHAHHIDAYRPLNSTHSQNGFALNGPSISNTVSAVNRQISDHGHHTYHNNKTITQTLEQNSRQKTQTKSGGNDANITMKRMPTETTSQLPDSRLRSTQNRSQNSSENSNKKEIPMTLLEWIEWNKH